MSQPLYTHVPHPHVARNVNTVHHAEHGDALNQRIAVWLTRYVGTMQTAYGFAALAIIGLLGVLTILNPNVYTFIAWLSQTLLQLVLLPVIMVGQNVLNRHTELQADEAFATTQKSFHDIEQIIAHLDAQDAELLKHAELLQQLLTTATAPRRKRAQPS